MVVADQSRFLITVVILGFVLAVLFFRPPQIFPQNEALKPIEPREGLPGQTAGQPPENSDQEPTLREVQLEAPEAAQNDSHEERSKDLDEREAQIIEREEAQDLHQRLLDEREAEIIEREGELDIREAQLIEHEVELDHRDRANIKLQHRLREEEERAGLRASYLREWEGRLAEQEQRLRGLNRLSIVAAILTGLLALPSVGVLLGLARSNQAGTRVARSPAYAPKWPGRVEADSQDHRFQLTGLEAKGRQSDRWTASGG